MNDGSWTTLTTLCLAVGCGPSVPFDGNGSSSGSGDDTTGPASPDLSAPDPTRPGPDSGISTSDATGGTTGSNDGVGSSATGELPGSGGCCEVHSSPSCNEPAVVDCVCAQEAFCCAFDWDQTCVDLAMGECRALCEAPVESTGGGSTTGDPVDPTVDPTGDPVDPTTGGMKGACDELVTFEMEPAEAIYSGAWVLGVSGIGEGEIAVLDDELGFDGSFRYEPDIPCADTWYIWTRYWESGPDDSYFVTLDGEPRPEAIFEGDCTGGGQGYDWAALNWRDQGASACEYLEDPWSPQWDAGVHSIEFSYRESLAMGRILLTNDPDFEP